ncbi:hypothetical protein ACQPTN_09430 [Bradyrhizobium sp. 13971]
MAVSAGVPEGVLGDGIVRDTITNYQFWDSTADPASGHFVVGGVIQPTGQNIDVSAAQLASTSFQSGSGSDDLWVRAFDGMTWSNWKEFHVNAPVDNLPIVTAADYSASHGQNIAASTLFSITDADADTITNYQVWDRRRMRAAGTGWSGKSPKAPMPPSMSRQLSFRAQAFKAARARTISG